MKKVISFIAFVIILIHCLLPCVAINANYQNAEFDRIFKEVYNFFIITQISPPYSGEIPFPPYNNCEYLYTDIDESRLPGGSLNSMKAYANTLFTEDILDIIFHYNRYEGLYQNKYVDNLPLFVETSTGLKWYPLTMGVYYFQHYFHSSTDPVIFDNMVIKDNIATGNVLMWLNESMPMYWIPIKFVRTEQGWRLGDCEIFRWMWTPSQVNIDDFVIRDKDVYEKYNPYFEFDPSRLPFSPSTADPSFDSFVLLPAVSLACLVPAVCLLRRRRRRNVI